MKNIWKWALLLLAAVSALYVFIRSRDDVDDIPSAREYDAF